MLCRLHVAKTSRPESSGCFSAPPGGVSLSLSLSLSRSRSRSGNAAPTEPTFTTNRPGYCPHHPHTTWCFNWPGTFPTCPHLQLSSYFLCHPHSRPLSLPSTHLFLPIWPLALLLLCRLLTYLLNAHHLAARPLLWRAIYPSCPSYISPAPP